MRYSLTAIFVFVFLTLLVLSEAKDKNGKHKGHGNGKGRGQISTKKFYVVRKSGLKKSELRHALKGPHGGKSKSEEPKFKEPKQKEPKPDKSESNEPESKGPAKSDDKNPSQKALGITKPLVDALGAPLSLPVIPFF